MSRALVISGGGSKGAFAVGVIKKLFNQYPKLTFDIYVGTSTGSLIVPFVALNKIAALEKIFTTQKTENIILQNRLGDRINNTSIFDSSPLWQLLTENYTDNIYSDLLATNKKLFLTTVCLQSAKLIVFTNDKTPASSENYDTNTLINGDHFRKAVLASSSEPVFMPPVKVNKYIENEINKEFQFIDGGVKEHAGIRIAIDNGATEIFTIILSSNEKIVEYNEYTDLLSILQKTVDIFTDNVSENDLQIPFQYNEALIYIEEVKNNMKKHGISDEQINQYFTVSNASNPYQNQKPLKFFTFRPDTPLGGGPGGLIFDPEEMKLMVKRGESTAENFIAAVNPADISWA